MRRHARRLLAAIGVTATLAVLAPDAAAASRAGSSDVTAGASRPVFKMPFRCGQKRLGGNWDGHSPAHSIDWNHFGRRVLASAGGEVVASYYSTGTGYGSTVVIAHGNGRQTRYSHLSTRDVRRGDRVGRGHVIGRVGTSSALYDLSPHLRYEQIHDGRVVAVVQGVTWSDHLKRYQVGANGCG